MTGMGSKRHVLIKGITQTLMQSLSRLIRPSIRMERMESYTVLLRDESRCASRQTMPSDCKRFCTDTKAASLGGYLPDNESTTYTGYQ